VAEWSKARPC